PVTVAAGQDESTANAQLRAPGPLGLRVAPVTMEPMPDSQSDSRPDRPSGHAPDLDVVLLGATGFVGRLTAQHLAAHAPADLRWAVAARSEEALQRLVADLVDQPTPPVTSVVVDVTDTTSLDALAAR